MITAVFNVNGGVFLNSKKLCTFLQINAKINANFNFTCCISISEVNFLPYNLMAFAFMVVLPV